MKTLSIMMIVMLAVSMVLTAAPTIFADESSDDSSDAIALYDNTSNIPEGMVISPAPSADSSIEEEAAEEDNATTSTGEIVSTQIKSWFTFNAEKKAELELKLANLRLIQARTAAKNGNEQAMTKALEAHERIIQRVQERMQNFKADSNAQALNDSVSRLVGLERAIQVHELKIGRLNDLLQNANFTDEQKTRIEARIQNVQNATNSLVELSAQKEENMKTRLMAVHNLTEEEAEQVIVDKEVNAEVQAQEQLQIQQNKPAKSGSKA